ncbi:hypothetical protein BDW62DRAFT_215060 [Aspergillus aurantiobrunneus]
MDVFERTPGFEADMAKIVLLDKKLGTHLEGCSRIFTPPFSRETTTSTTRALFTALDLGASPQQSEEVRKSDQRGSRGANLSPNLNVSTSRDLYDATPSPQSTPESDTSRANVPNPNSPSPPHLGSVTSGDRDVIFQSIETSSTQGEGCDAADVDSDINSNEGSDDDNYTYSVWEEDLPAAPIYDVSLQNSLRAVRSHLADLVVSMESSQMVLDETTDINDLHKRVKIASRFEYPETRIVGFIGDSGAGKSSLINALLDQEGLARSSGNGDACTTVVTEFRQVDQTHQYPYTIEADFMNIDEMKELLQELLKSYRIRHTRAFSEVSDQQEIERITLLSGRAFMTLKSLFPNEEELTEVFLSSEEPRAEEVILTRLEEWALAGLDHRPGGRDVLHHRIEAQDIYDCRENIDTLTVASVEPGRPALWPFVKLIRVYLRSRILRTGLVVADLPGFRDLNYARIRATERYLRDVCDEVFVVSTIIRCGNNPSIRETLEPDSSQELDAEESIRDPQMPARVKTEARRLLDHINQVKQSLTTMAYRRRRSSGAQQAQARSDFIRLKRLLIEARNELVVTSLSNQYSADVRVFCVSSNLYKHYRADDSEQSSEYIQLSGIPELRRYCQSVPADAQLRATSGFLRIRVPALLGSLNQWMLAGSNAVTIDRAATLRRVLDDAQRTLESRLTSRNSCIRSVQTDLTRQFRNSIIRYIRNSQERWKAGAIRASQDWETMYHSTYAAFCRKYGAHQPGMGAMRYWNSEVLQDANDELGRAWGTLLAWLEDQQDTAEAQIDDIFDSVSTSIEDYTHLAPEALENLLDNLETQKYCITDTVQRSLEGLLSQSMRIGRDTLDGHSSSSYIADIMRPVYNICNAESGRGSDARRKGYMDQHVRYSEIFPRLSNSVQADYMGMLDDVFTDLGQKLDGEVRDISRDLGLVIPDEGEVSEAGREPELAQRVRAGVSDLQPRLNEAHLILDRLHEGNTGTT